MTPTEKILEEFRKKFGYMTGGSFIDMSEQYASFESFLLSSMKFIAEQAIEAGRVEEMKPPHEVEDLEIEENQILSDKTIRNAVKHIENASGQQLRDGYNSAREASQKKSEKWLKENFPKTND